MDFKAFNIVNVETMFFKSGLVPRVFLFNRPSNDKLNRQIEIFDSHIFPYFHVASDAKLPDEVNLLVFDRQKGPVAIDGTQTTTLRFIGANSDSMYKISKILFEAGIKTYEADLKFTPRFIIDSGLQYSSDKRILYIDIETYGCNDINAPEPITSLVINDSFTSNYVCWCWQPKFEVEVKEGEYRRFKTEEAMLDNFLEWYSNNWPDIITGWYNKGFDMLYLYNRIVNLGLDPRRLSQVEVVFLKEDKFNNTSELRIFGCEILDLMDAVKYNIYKNPPDYSLNTCGNFFLGEEKEKVESVVDLWENNIDFLVKYNRKDVELCVRLDAALELISYYNSIQRILPMPLQEIDFKSKIVDYYILRKYKNIAFPSKQRGFEAIVAGGFVKEPKTGLFKNVIILDVSSMYPNIYITFNISHDTLSSSGTTNLNGWRFVSRDKKQGLIPAILADLLVERYKMKAERDENEKGSVAYRMLDERQTALKEVMNSFYGVMALPSYRLFNPIIANSVTFVGRSMIKWAIRYIEEHSNFKVLYTDTDSVFIKLPDELSQEESIVAGNKIKDAVNSHLSSFCADFDLKQQDSDLDVPKRLLTGDANLHTLAFEFEKYFSAIIFTGAKKKYMGLVKWQDGKVRDEVYARGFETIRADTPLPIKSLLLEVYKDILSFKSEKFIVDKINTRFENIMKTIAVYELASAKYINKEIDEYVVKPQHVKAAEYSNKHLGTNFHKSTKPRIIYVKKIPRGYPRVEVIAVSETIDIRALGFTIDKKKYKRKLLQDKLKEVFKIMKWRDLEQDVSQYRLDSMFE